MWAVFQPVGLTYVLCPYVFPDGIFGMSEDELMYSDEEDVDDLSVGQNSQSQLSTPAANKLLCLNRLAGH